MGIKSLEPEKRQELVIYSILWGLVLFLVPAVALLREESGFRFAVVRDLWLGTLPFFFLFLLHHFLAAPLLVKKGRPWGYLGLTLVLVVLFASQIWRNAPGPPPGGYGRPPVPFHEQGRVPMDPGVMKIIIGLLIIGTDLGIKYYMKAIRSTRRMQELQVENLGQQLETLRYQISPHFFMNTLNNIHALVDIDPEKAKESIEEFSKLMRYVLYEQKRPTIPLQKELDFLRHYVCLMRMRYTDAVQISLDLPDSDSDAEIPPLVLASFVENAFKHGISYEKASFVRITVEAGPEGIGFRCTNSRQGADRADSHGIGLENVRRRLDLLYPGRYSLDIEQDEKIYDVRLRLPQKALFETV